MRFFFIGLPRFYKIYEQKCNMSTLVNKLNKKKSLVTKGEKNKDKSKTKK